MKATFVIISMIIGLLIGNTTNLLAQTKKIAWRSHGGTNVTFTFDLPDDFGRIDPKYYEKPKEKNLRDSTAIVDSLAVCTPEKTVKDLKQIEKEKQAEKREKRKEIRQEYRQDIKQLKEEKKEAIKARAATNTTQTVQTAAIISTPTSATQWLWLLLLPLGVIFITSIKKP